MDSCYIFGIVWMFIGALDAAVTNKGFVATVQSYDFDNPIHLRSFPASEDNPINFDFDTIPLDSGNSLQSVNNFSTFLSCDVDYSRGKVYVYDYIHSDIYRINNFKIPDLNKEATMDVIHFGVTGEYVKLAVDWISHNIYWTDYAHKWIAIQPDNATDSSMYAIVVRDLNAPAGVAVDPKAGFLFWTDVGYPEKIERATLSGKHRTTIVSTSLKFPDNIALDTDDQRIYWVDYRRGTLETCTYYGRHRKIIFRQSRGELYGLTIIGDYVLATDIETEGIVMYNKQTGSEVSSHSHWMEMYIGLCPWIPQTRDSGDIDECGTKNCQHICVDEGKNVPAICLCKEGYLLNRTDNITCYEDKGIHHMGVLFTNGTDICIMDIRGLTKAVYQPVCSYRVNNVNESINFFDVDANNGRMIIASANRKIYYKYLNEDTTEELLETAQDITGLAYDWKNHNLYWSHENSIHVFATSDRTEVQLIPDPQNTTDILINPRELVVLPNISRLLWISGTNESYRIEVANFGESSRRTLVESYHLTNPMSLTFDATKQRLYWVDTGMVYFYNIKSGESGRSKLQTESPVLTLAYKEFFVWTTAENTTYTTYHTAEFMYVAWNTQTSGPVGDMGIITGMKVLDPALQPYQNGPCVDFNGGCAHVCIPMGQVASCICEFGFTLGADGKSCGSEPVEENFLLMADRTHHTIYQMSLETENLQGIYIGGRSDPYGVAFDETIGSVVWTSFGEHSVKRTSLVNHETHTVTTDYLLMNPSRIALDSTTGNVFYISLTGMYSLWPSDIRVVSPDGQFKILIDNLEQPTDIVIDPAKGYVFWTDQGWTAYIGRANMDGTDQRTITTDLVYPSGIAVDYDKEMIYWADSFLDRIEMCGYDGLNRTTFYETTGKYIFMSDIAIDGMYLYYIANDKTSITRINRQNTNDVIELANHAELGVLSSIAIVSNIKQPKNDDCSYKNGNCSTFCLPTPAGRTCSCPDLVNLLADGRTCEGVQQCPGNIQNAVPKWCNRYIGEQCHYECDRKYQPKVDVPVITCKNDSTWDVSNPCEAKHCPATIPNGNIHSSCDRMVDSNCTFACSPSYMKRSGVSTVQCLSSKQWSPPSSSLCLPMTCPSSIPRGIIDSSCSRFINSICAFRCLSAFVRNGSVATINCLPTGEWSPDSATVCLLPPPPSVAEGRSSVNPAAIGGGIGAVVAVILIVIIVVVVYLILRRRKKSILSDELNETNLPYQHFDKSGGKSDQPSVSYSNDHGYGEVHVNNSTLNSNGRPRTASSNHTDSGYSFNLQRI